MTAVVPMATNYSSTQTQCIHTLSLSLFSALQRAVEGCSDSFSPHITGDLLQLLFTSFQHTNRFVRETAYNVTAAIVSCPGKALQ